MPDLIAQLRAYRFLKFVRARQRRLRRLPEPDTLGLRMLRNFRFAGKVAVPLPALFGERKPSSRPADGLSLPDLILREMPSLQPLIRLSRTQEGTPMLPAANIPGIESSLPAVSAPAFPRQHPGPGDKPSGQNTRRAERQGDMPPMAKIAKDYQPASPGPLSRKPEGIIPRSEKHSSKASSVAPTISADAAGVASERLPERLARKYRGFLQLRLPAVQIYKGPRIDLILQQQRAEGMASGRRIFVPSQSDPDTPGGAALLGHELTHVAQSEAGGGAVENSGNYRGGERQALENERLILGNYPVFAAHPAAATVDSVGQHRGEMGALGTERLTLRNAPVLREQPSAVATPAVTPVPALPRFARTDRFAGTGDAVPPSSGSLSGEAMQRIKEEVYRDIMMRIKIDFERGG